MDRFTADTARLAERAGRFDGLAERVGAVHRDLADRLAAAGSCWGGDEIGQAFAATHVRAADATLAEVGALPAKLDDVGTRLRDTARAYADTETTNTRALGSVDV
ncbi:WXG100 family type VII secretion target [Actinokineospora auranticolor]|uniref:Type VII secretion system (Wss) protein ESAT-6 n=1 Tax=Actinokineospora auranticolor TaxID=155976 RepID=A0A2S6GX53_9PSEU|nr:WXG100 family type VII secretion target [Actinokineospora auranticolor]PPK69777.1 type VII secretion system (Wss) protein ESAT-6 [Actinokineospora auranticolor]